MNGLLRWVAVAVVCGLGGVPTFADDDTRQKGGQEGADQPKLSLPRMRYEHTTQAGRVGKFTLDGRKGTADYYFNGQHHRDDLEFVRNGTLNGSPGWIYQVVRNGKKQSLWFFFGSRAVRTPDGRQAYPMYYSEQPDNPDGKKPWRQILTPSGTKAEPLGGKGGRKEDEE
jgi:hypothetical protein